MKFHYIKLAKCLAFITLIFFTVFFQCSASAIDNEPVTSPTTDSAAGKIDTADGKRSTSLYGRIEQMSDEDGGTPKLRLPDAENKKNEDGQQSIPPNKPLSGKVITDYPDTFPLHWGGHIELIKTNHKSESFVPGLSGNIRFDFQRSKNGLALKPPAALFWVPLKNSHFGKDASAMLAQGRSAYLNISTKNGPVWSSKSFRLQTEDLDKPIVAVSMNLGLHGEKRNSLNGQRWKIQMIQDSLRQLEPDTFEQDAIALMIPSSSAGKEYEEQVIRLKLNEDQKSMSVKIADLHFDSAGTFLDQTDYEGTIIAGEEVDTKVRGYAVLSSPDSDSHYLFH
jgi:hypothetical protein